MAMPPCSKPPAPSRGSAPSSCRRSDDGLTRGNGPQRPPPAACSYDGADECGGSAMASNDEGWLAAMKRGLRRHCPRCDAPGMFIGYLKVAPRCQRCGLEFEAIRSDDVAPYFTILIVGHIVVPLLLTIEQWYAPPAWLQMAVALPATLLLTLDQ